MPRQRQRGFTLLEVLVATTIMAVAIVGLVSMLSSTIRNAARLTDYDRATILAKRKMDDLLLDRQTPRCVPIQGSWPAEATGSAPVGWRAVIIPLSYSPQRPAPERPEDQIAEAAENRRLGHPAHRGRIQCEPLQLCAAQPARAVDHPMPAGVSRQRG